MSSVSGSSSVNGLYSNPNQITGLVSGLDTQSMVEGLVDSYNQKIIGYQQDIVKVQWQQEAYQDVIGQLNTFLGKYTSFTNSSSNLFSASIFNSATTTVAGGANSSAVSVSGTSNSEITIDSILQTATSARTETSALTEYASGNSITSGEGVSLVGESPVGNLSGTVTVSYGSSSFGFDFSSADVIVPEDGQSQGAAFAAALNQQLDDAGNTDIKAVWDESSSSLTFETYGSASSNGDKAWISSCSSSIKSTLGISTSSSYDSSTNKIDFSSGDKALTKIENNTSLISGKDISITFNDVSRTLTMPTIGTDSDGNYTVNGESIGSADASDLNDNIITAMNDELYKMYGTGLTVSNADESGSTLQLSFDIQTAGTNTLRISSSIGETLGFGGSIATNYVNTGDSLGSLLGEDFFTSSETLIPSNGSITLNSTATYYYDGDGDRVIKGDDDNWYKAEQDEDGTWVARTGESLTINGVEVGVFDRDSSLSDVLTAINGSSAGVTASFSTLTNKIVFTSNETGSNGQITFDDDSDLSVALFGSSEDHKTTEGQDAIALVTVNGEQIELVRSTNTFSLDGLSVTLKSTFNDTIDGKKIDLDDLDGDYSGLWDDIEFEDVITFTEETDVDPLVDLITEMVNDYNEMMSNIKSYFTEVPLTTTTGSYYEPLTDDDAADMTESAIATYETKAKTGILFGDTNMRSLYNSLSTVFSASGVFGSDLSAMGFDLAYDQSSSGSMVDLDTDKLKEMLQSDIERVKNVFISSTDNGFNTDGLMSTLKSKMNTYGGTTGSPKGILVEAAGTELSATSLLSNAMQSKIDAFNTLIESWEDKLSNKVDYYTSKFTALEVLMSNANSQMSALQGLGSSY